MEVKCIAVLFTDSVGTKDKEKIDCDISELALITKYRIEGRCVGVNFSNLTNEGNGLFNI